MYLYKENLAQFFSEQPFSILWKLTKNNQVTLFKLNILSKPAGFKIGSQNNDQAKQKQYLI